MVSGVEPARFLHPALEAACEAGSYEWWSAEDRLTWSPGLLRIYGLAVAPDGEAGFSGLVHPDDRVRVEAETSEFLGSKAAAYSHRFRIIRADGAVRHIVDRGVIERDARGRVRLIRGVNIDLTGLVGPGVTDKTRDGDAAPLRALREAHASWLAAEAQRIDFQERAQRQFAELDSLYREAPLGLGLVDRDLRFVRINAALAETNGYSIEEHLSRTVWELVPGLRATVEPALRHVLESGEPLRDVVVRGETPARAGVVREWREHFYPLRGSAGSVEGVGIVCEEVTARVDAERALAESEARLRAALRGGRLGVHEFDPRTGVIVWDATVRGIWGVTADEPITLETFAAGVHPDDLAATKAAVDAALEPEGPGRFQAVYRVVHRRTGEVRWVRAEGDVTFENGVAVRLVGTVQDITEHRASEEALRAAHDTFRQLVDRSPFGIYAVDADFRLVQVSDGAQKVFENVRPLIGRDFAEVLRIIWPEPFATEAIERFRHTLATGEPYHAPKMVERRADVEATEAYDWKIERITLPDGRRGVVCHFYDLSERQRHEEHVRLLMGEVSHRSKNMLTLIQAIARQTAAGGASDFVERFSRRVQSLAAAQDLLVKHGWRAVPLADLVDAQLAHVADVIDERVDMAGPELLLTPAASQTFGMVLHELATNAVKYGALSNETGRIAIVWDLQPDAAGKPRFTMSWAERGGPPVGQPRRIGFGSTVTTRMVKMSVNGQVSVDYAPSGLVWHLACPADTILEGHERLVAVAAERRANGDAPLERRGRRRVLVVEDEPLIAIEVAGILEEAGIEVIGPAGTVAAALALLDGQGCDAAVLDVHLGEETSEPVGRWLMGAGTPFLVVSGYARVQLPELFATAPFLSKPLRAELLKAKIELCLGASGGAIAPPIAPAGGRRRASA